MFPLPSHVPPPLPVPLQLPAPPTRPPQPANRYQRLFSARHFCTCWYHRWQTAVSGDGSVWWAFCAVGRGLSLFCVSTSRGWRTVFTWWKIHVRGFHWLYWPYQSKHSFYPEYGRLRGTVSLSRAKRASPQPPALCTSAASFNDTYRPSPHDAARCSCPKISASISTGGPSSSASSTLSKRTPQTASGTQRMERGCHWQWNAAGKESAVGPTPVESAVG